MYRRCYTTFAHPQNMYICPSAIRIIELSSIITRPVQNLELLFKKPVDYREQISIESIQNIIHSSDIHIHKKKFICFFTQVRMILFSIIVVVFFLKFPLLLVIPIALIAIIQKLTCDLYFASHHLSCGMMLKFCRFYTSSVST